LGQDSKLRYAWRAVLDVALVDAQMSPEVRAALASGDRQALEALLGATGNVCCTVHAPLEEDDEDEIPPKSKLHKDEESDFSEARLSRIA
jgi:hypothetical protein